MKNLLLTLLFPTIPLFANLSQELASDSFVHMDASQITNGICMEKSMQLAQSAGVKVALELADADLLKKFRERILALVETYTDILYIDEKDAYALTQLPPDKSALFLKNFCLRVVVKVGDHGSWICSEEGLFWQE